MIYILAIEPPLQHARYYVGYCDDDRLERRLQHHNAGTGAALTRAAIQTGRTLRLVATLDGDRAAERRLKNQKNTPRIVRRLQAC